MPSRLHVGRAVSVWRNTLDHFDAIKIGLTATPAAHTMAYFNERRLPLRVRAGGPRGLPRRLRRGRRSSSDVRMNGVFLKEGEQVERGRPGDRASSSSTCSKTSASSTPPRSSARSPPRTRTARSSRSSRSTPTSTSSEYGRFPKTLIFAANDLPHTSHADQLVDLAATSSAAATRSSQKITGRVDRPLQRIREFRNRPNPGIVVTVDLLTTGVDIPDLEFIVFLRPVKSRILFEQMLGRGTRKGEKYPGQVALHRLRLLRRHAARVLPQDAPASPPSRRTSRRQTHQRDHRGHLGEPGPRLQHPLPRQAAPAHRQGDVRRGPRAVRRASSPTATSAAFAEELPARSRATSPATMKLLRDADFQDLLVDYPRAAAHVHRRAERTEDDVSSEWLIRDGDGQEYKPEDYLEAFAAFVRENHDAGRGDPHPARPAAGLEHRRR